MDKKKLRCTTEVDYPYFPFRISVDYVLVSRLDDLSKQFQRTLFEDAIRREGLVVHHEYAGPMCFTLISTPFHRLCKEAEKNQLSFPLKDCPVDPALPSCCFTLSELFVTDDTVHYIRAPFQKRCGDLYVNYNNEKLFLNTSRRSMLTYQILTEIDIAKDMGETSRGSYTSNSNTSDSVVITDAPLKRKGLQYLLMEEAYEDSFILHEPSEVEPYMKKMKDRSSVDFMELLQDITEDPRKRLGSLWERWFKFQPLNLIRDYFGEQIAYYFAWQGTFITLLWPATLLGLIVFIYGFVKSVKTSPATFGNCTVIQYDGGTNIVPCQFRDSASQVFSMISSWFMNSFDNELNAFFAAFMSIWGSLFYQLWRRNNSVLIYQWDCEDYQEVEPDRPEFTGTEMREDPITGETEMFSPNVIRYFKMLISAFLVFLCMTISVMSVICVTLYKMWIVTAKQCDKDYTFTCSLAAAYAPSLLNTLSTMFLGFLYGKIVEKLNNWENHRTMSEHNNSLIIKLFAFQMVNNYTSLFYIAFVRPESNGFQANGLFGLGPKYRDVCTDGTCGSLLAVQLLTHMVIKPIPKFTKDIIIPYFHRLIRMSWFRNRTETLQSIVQESDETNVLVREWMKPNPGDFTLWEFNEKIILFGTTMMFASLFPLAPLLALLIGLIDLRIDAHRLLWFNRRPVAAITTGIGIWLPILTTLQYAAVITNAFIIAFTSDFCSNFFSSVLYCDIRNRLLIVIVFQNLVFVLKYVLQGIIPTEPASIRVAQRRKRYVIGHIIEKGDVPYRIKNRKRARKAKIAWLSSRGRSLMKKKKIDIEQIQA